ncbi:GIY-YIG nuclease family protein [Candidatus Peregrinibacteria bacterium]|nr:GIY-YIG nuclease family protein [Candidatus Peregrinibacteria bacterium]
MPRIGVYILEGSRYYVGSTNDLDRRLMEHEHGRTHTTQRIGKPPLLFLQKEVASNSHRAAGIE